MTDEPEIQPPAIVPALGFYYHYKHKPDGPVNHRAIEVLGVSVHTEDVTRFSVIFRSLYDSSAYRAGKLLEDLPLESWMSARAGGGLRYQRITEPDIIRLLDTHRRILYGSSQ